MTNIKENRGRIWEYGGRITCWASSPLFPLLVPVIDLTTSPSDVAIDGPFLQGAQDNDQNESSSNDVIYGPFLPGEQDRNHAESSHVINVDDVIDFETQFLVEVEIEHAATIPTSTTPPLLPLPPDLD